MEVERISISKLVKKEDFFRWKKGKFCDINFDYYTECSLLAKMSLSNKNSFFDTNNDIDDDAFLNHPRAGSSGFMLPQSSNQGGINQFQPVQQSRQEASASGIMSPDEKHRQLMLLQKEIEARTVDSSNRSLGLLYESEKVGAATGEELHRQKEQLLRTEGRLDEINSTLKQSERHLNGIKSVFGGIKNYLFAKNSGLPPPSPQQAIATTSSQNQIPHSNSDASIGSSSSRKQFYSQAENDRLDTIREQNHPALRSRGLVEEDSAKTMASVDEVLDRNLDEMAMGLSRLKGLALDLNAELDEHDDILIRLDDKASRTGIKVEKQNKDMSKILKK